MRGAAESFREAACRRSRPSAERSKVASARSAALRARLPNPYRNIHRPDDSRSEAPISCSSRAPPCEDVWSCDRPHHRRGDGQLARCGPKYAGAGPSSGRIRRLVPSPILQSSRAASPWFLRAGGMRVCHVPKERWIDLDAGQRLPLSGSHVFRLPFGELFSANLTPDQVTGIGRRSDGELARVLRHGVRADNRAAFPLMEFQELSDDDLTAILSFLRSRPAVANEVPEHRLSLLGKALMAFAIEPTSAPAPPPLHSPAAARFR